MSNPANISRSWTRAKRVRAIAMLGASLLLCSCFAGAMAIRGAAGVAARGAAFRVGASRLVVADPLIGMAARRGVLSQALQQTTAGGTRMAVLTIERGGLIRAGPDVIARLELTGGRIMAGGRVEGILENGIIYEYVSGGRVGVAALRGFIPSRGVTIASANGTTQVQIQRNLMVQVLEIRDGFYRIRLPGGQELMVGAELVALAMVAADGGTGECGDSSGILVRVSGRSIPFESCAREDGVFRLRTAQGTILVDSLDVTEIVPGRIEDVTAHAVRFTGGYALYGNVERLGDVVRVVDERGGVTVADVLRLEGSKI